MSALPAGWAKTTIGSIAELVNGRAFKPGDWSRAGLPIVRIQNLNNPAAPFNHFSGPVAERHMVRAGDLLFAWSGTPGTSFGAHIWRGDDAVLNQHILNVRVNESAIDIGFLRIAINATLEEQIAKAHGGAGLRHVTKGAFEATEIVLPPLAEQRRIMARLSGIQERLARARAHLNQASDSTEKARQALLRAAYELALLPEASRSAPRVRVSDVATSLTYGTSAKSQRRGGTPVLRMGNIQNGEVDWTDLAYSNDKSEIEAYRLEAGDVLFNRTNSPELVGKTAIYRGERPALFAGYLIRIRVNDSMLPEYLTYCLNSPAGREYCRSVKSDGVSQSNINAKKLAAFELLCPSLADQRAIVERVRSGLIKLAAAVKAVDSGIASIAALERRFVQEALEGRLSARDSRDEPAQASVEQLVQAKKNRDRRAGEAIVRGAESMRDKIADILRQAKGWTSADELARLYGLSAGASTDEVEPFYEELRALDKRGELVMEATRNAKGKKIGERMRLKANA